MGAASPLLQAIGIGKRFNALVVLEGVDFAMLGGEAVGIVGPNGAGKTTFLAVLAGAHPPSAGSIRGSNSHRSRARALTAAALAA